MGVNVLEEPFVLSTSTVGFLFSPNCVGTARAGAVVNGVLFGRCVPGWPQIDGFDSNATDAEITQDQKSQWRHRKV